MLQGRPEPIHVAETCQHAHECGGCDTIEIVYREQVRWKEAALRELLAPVTKNATWDSFLHLPDEPRHMRSKIRYGFIATEQGIVASRHGKGNAQADIPMQECLLQSERSVAYAHTTASFAAQSGWTVYNPYTKKGWLYHLLVREPKRGSGVVVGLITAPGKEDLSGWISLMRSTYPDITGLLHLTFDGNKEEMKETTLWGDPYCYEEVLGNTFRIAPQAFFQTNGALVETLYGAALEYAGSGKVAYDLDAGAATIGICLHKQFESVFSLESSPHSKADALWNCEHNNITNVHYESGKVEDLLTSAGITARGLPDCCVIDPPRAGIVASVANILPRIARRTVYVSCNPDTFLRDAKLMMANGYRLTRIRGVDMFPHTRHCEVVALFER